MERYTPDFIREMVVEGYGQKLNIVWYIYVTQDGAAVIKNKMCLYVHI